MSQANFRVRYLFVGIALCGGGMDCPAWAQDPAAPAVAGAAQPNGGKDAPSAEDEAKDLRRATAEDLDLDMPSLLASRGSVGVPADPVWTPNPKPVPGKKVDIVAVPIRISGAGFKASSPPINPGEGNFVAWYIPRAAEAPQKPGSPPSKRTPAGASRFASGFSVTEDGQIHWSVERFTNSMKMSAASSLTDEMALYPLSMDHRRLTAQRPVRPPPPKPYQKPARNPGEPPAGYAARQEAARNAYDAMVAATRKNYEDKSAIYEAAQARVAALPDQFSEPHPDVVYAVYYVAKKVYVGQYAAYQEQQERKQMVLSYTGYPKEQGNWKIPAPAWDALCAMASGSRALDPEIAKLLEAQVASGHPAALRAVAVGLANSGLLNDLSAESAPYRLAAQVFKTDDATARKILSQGLVAANVSTGKAELLKLAVLATAKAGDEVGGSDLSVASLHVLLRAKETDTDPKRVAATVQAMADAHGPSPKAALAELLEMLKPDTDKGAAAREFERAKRLSPAFKAADIADKQRRRAALAAVLGASSKNQTAAVLADDSLLGASDAGIVAETLAVMAAAAQDPAGARVPLPSAQHHLIGLLGSSDEAVRAAAWKALPAAQLAGTDQVQAAVCRCVMDAGLAISPTPPELAVFLNAQAARPETRVVAVGELARLLALGGDDAAKQALDMLSRPELATDFAAALVQFDPNMRYKAVARCYSAKSLPVPDSAGIVLAPKGVSDTVARWFGEEFAKSRLPMAARFAEQVGDDTQLLDWVLEQDVRLARGAVAVLAYHQGADDMNAAAAVTQMLNKPYKLRAQLDREWEDCKNNLFMARVKSTAGERSVLLATFRRGDKEWRTAVAGQVTLQWGEAGMSMGVPGVMLQAAPEKKALMLAELGLVDRVNSKTRRAVDMADLSGPVEFAWKAPCWEAQWRPEADRVVIIQIAPVGWKKELQLPAFDAKSAK